MEIELLRQETLESQTVRSDLLKWKLLLVASLGSVGLGLGQVLPQDTAMSGAGITLELVLCLIPLVCLYVDLLCNHMTVRMIVIGTFLREYRASDHTNLWHSYEKFVQQLRSLPRLGSAKGEIHPVRANAYELEDWALRYSTIFLSFLVFIYGIVYLMVRNPGCTSSEIIVYYSSVLLFLGWGLAGVVGSWYLHRRFKRLVDVIESKGREHPWDPSARK